MPLRIKQLKACSLTLHVSRMHYLFSDFKRKCCSISLQVLGLGVILKWDDVGDLLSHIALSEIWKCVDKNSYDTTNFFVVRKLILIAQFILNSSVFNLKNAWSHRNWKTCSLTLNTSILISQFFFILDQYLNFHVGIDFSKTHSKSLEAIKFSNYYSIANMRTITTYS